MAVAVYFEIKTAQKNFIFTVLGIFFRSFNLFFSFTYIEK